MKDLTLENLVEKYGDIAKFLHYVSYLELDEIEKLLKNGNYFYFSNVDCYEELGKAVIRDKYRNFSSIPCELEEYFDYKQYGIDFIVKHCEHHHCFLCFGGLDVFVGW